MANAVLTGGSRLGLGWHKLGLVLLKLRQQLQIVTVFPNPVISNVNPDPVEISRQKKEKHRNTFLEKSAGLCPG